ncbi:MAG TPA: hypothetical protein VIZ70_05865 [Propionibacteriaceae bacterium]
MGVLDRAEPARERPTPSRDPIRIRDPSPSTWSSVGFVHLQRAAGNRAVVRLLAGKGQPISGLTAGQTVVQRASYAKKVAPDLAATPITAFRWMNGLNVDGLTDTMRALKKTPEHWAAVTKNWTMISGLDQPVWRMVRKVVETNASDAVQTETYRVHHFVRGEMWPQAWSTLSGAAELDRVVGLLDTLHLQAMLPKLDTAGAGVDKVKVLIAMSMYTTLEGVAGSLDEATLRDVMQGHMIAQMHQVNTAGKSATSGVWYPYAYRASFPKEWAKHTDWKEGYADPAFFDRIGHMHWRLKAGASTADGIRSWLKGLTVAECATVMAVAMYESLLATIGKERFDKRFGGPGQPVADAARLRIAQGPEISEPGTENRPPPLRQFIDDLAHGATPGGEPGQRNVKKGNWYYFRNHPDYTKKHPGGWLAGENTLCTDDTRGHQLFSGFGRTMEGVTEMTMLERASEAYNTPQSPEEKKAGGVRSTRAR